MTSHARWAVLLVLGSLPRIFHRTPRPFGSILSITLEKKVHATFINSEEAYNEEKSSSSIRCSTWKTFERCYQLFIMEVVHV